MHNTDHVMMMTKKWTLGNVLTKCSGIKNDGKLLTFEEVIMVLNNYDEFTKELILENKLLRVENDDLKKFMIDPEGVTDENRRLTDKLNNLALEFYGADMISICKATEIAEMRYMEFVVETAKRGKPVELRE